MVLGLQPACRGRTTWPCRHMNDHAAASHESLHHSYMPRWAAAVSREDWEALLRVKCITMMANNLHLPQVGGRSLFERALSQVMHQWKSYTYIGH